MNINRDTTLDLGSLPSDTTEEKPSYRTEYEQKTQEEEILKIDSINEELTNTGAVPISLQLLNIAFLILTFFFFIQLALAFFNLAFINGFVSLVAGTSIFGLYKVFNRVAKVIENKSYDD